MTYKEVIYLFRANADPKSNYEIKGERYRVYVEVDPEMKPFYDSEKITKLLVKEFSHKVRKSIRDGDKKTNFNFIQTLEIIPHF